LIFLKSLSAQQKTRKRFEKEKKKVYRRISSYKNDADTPTTTPTTTTTQKTTSGVEEGKSITAKGGHVCNS
jgi:hypothetical protein